MTSVLCPECQRTIGSPTGLTAHMKSMHPDVHMRNVEAERARTSRPLASVPPPSSPSNDNGIRWEEPPPLRAGRGIAIREAMLTAIVQLKRNPGRWARVREFKSLTGAGGAVGKLKTEFTDIEWVGRRVYGENEIQSAIFARYVEDD